MTTDSPLVAAVVARGSRRRIRKGAVLFHEDSAATEVFLIQKGRVKITSTSESGRETLLAVRGPGDLLGEISALDGARRSAAATAIDSVELVAVTAEVFVDVLGRHPGAGLALVRVLTGRLRDADRKRAEFGTADASVRVARRLLELADRYGVVTDEGVRIDLALTQDELASWTGASREAVAKALRALREDGTVATGRKSVIVTDLEGLRGRAGD